MFSSRLIQNITLIIVALVLGLAALWGLIAGIRAGKSNIVLQNTAAVDQGLQYFYNDQGRYPTALEFQDRNLMLNYLNRYPVPDIPGGPCSQTFRYGSVAPKKFTLEFCLPKSAQGFSLGWNLVTE